MLNIKAEHRLSEKAFDSVAGLIKEILPHDNVVPDSFYSTKKLMRGLGLPVNKIDCCLNNCMIYWGEDSELRWCKICGQSRFKNGEGGASSSRRKSVPYKRMHYFPLTPCLQRLYRSEASAADMRWHAEHESKEDEMRHPSDSKAWKHFNESHPDFAEDIRNVRLGLCTDGFQPFGQAGQ